MKSHRDRLARPIRVLFLCLISSSVTWGKGSAPEDLLQGKIIVSDKSLPTHWNSVGSYVSQLKTLNKGTLSYDKKTGKAQLYYAAFFAKPVNDVQVNFVIYDTTGGAKVRKGAWEAFLGERGSRVLFNSVELDKEDIEMNRRYMISIESKRTVIATGSFILRGEGEHYSGKVTFTDDEVKKKDP